MKKNVLGRTGLEVSVAGFGVLPMGPSQLALPVEEGAAVIRYALERGINFIDTAQYYRTYPYIRRALEGGGFDRVVLCSKSLCADYEGMMEAVFEAQEALGREMIDIFLMHEVRSGQLAERTGAWQALVDARAKGLVRAIGLSTHHVDVAAAAAEMEELDVVFPLINYAGLGIRKGDAFATREEMLEAISACHRAGKGVFSMKAFGGGSLTAHYQQALNYVFSQPDIDSVMIGFGKTAEVPVTSLDAVCEELLDADTPMDYIKYDVEGAETEALLGSRRIIERDAPALLVSAYHRSADLFRLPILVHELNPAYKLHLRRMAGVPAWDINLYAVKA